ncbi:ABC transporter ATP-binding protein [Metabacillus malikii]|uniref:ATP-binding cassette subfamily B protein n=1 Tax=Metabacillus malikii TaxID=1504265 RepID=A0ABT9ZAT9_9BACI|nr:ABC transporter ATP-binding protein [Metabacillus malikii]MDQ0229374.1 ATP-binding cassette subfamily B protein [Metabacillus malikii]
MKANQKPQSFDFEQRFRNGPGKVEGAFKTLYMLYKGQFHNIALSFFFFLIKHSPVWIIPIITANMIDIASNPKEHSTTELWINLAIVAFIIIQNIPSQLLHISFLSKASRHVEAGLRSTLVRKLQHLSISYHSELRSGKLQSKVLRDVESIEFLSKQIMYSFSAALTSVVVAIGVTASKNLLVALFFVLVIPVAILLVYSFKRNLQKKNNEFRKQIETMSGQVAETLTMIPVTRAHGLEDLEIKKTDHTLSNLKGKGYKLDISEAYFGATGWVVFQLFQMFCLMFTAFLAYQGQITVGDVVMYQGFFTTILMSINQIINVYPQLAKGYESIISVSEVLFSTQTVEYQGKKKLAEVNGKITFEHVNFHYTDSTKHVLNDLNLEVAAGECVALVGASGAGKSTVLSMVLGFYRPNEGRLLIDGVPFDDVHMQSYRRKLAVVPQNTILFSGSIKDNITYGMQDVSEERLQEVIEMANLQDVIDDMPEGLDTMIGEHGGKLSGGQRQRIAIARAIIRDPQIILLDEATSALDNVSEYRVQQAIQKLIKGRTTFIVAHRLSTIRDADRIIVMQNGTCVEQGSFEELMNNKGEFYKLKQLQA